MASRVKPLIREMIQRYAPEFEESPSRRSGSWFQNIRHVPYFEFIVVDCSLREGVCSCDVAWGFFREWDGSYGTHQMQRATGLSNLRLGRSSVPMEKHYYDHDGTDNGVRRALNRIGSDLVDYALPWFSRSAQEATTDRLLQHGLDWIQSHHAAIPVTIRDDLKGAFAKVPNRPWAVDFPILEELKTELRRIAREIQVSSWHRQEIAVLAYDLLVYAGQSKG